MKAEVKNGKLFLEIPLDEPTPSKSGKMLMLASSNGFLKLEAKCPFSGRQISINFNAGVPNK